MIFRLETLARQQPIRTTVWEHELGNLSLAFFVWELSFGIFSLGIVAQQFQFGAIVFFAWELLFESFRLGFEFGGFRLATVAEGLQLGRLGLKTLNS